MTHTSSHNWHHTFAPKREPWYRGMLALMLLVALAAAVFALTPSHWQVDQAAATIEATPGQTPLDLGMASLTHIFHVPGGYVDSNYQQ